MAWPWRMTDLTDEQKLHRRHTLDRYGSYSILSIMIPILMFQLYRLLKWVSSERKRAKQEYSTVPSSPRLKASKHQGSKVFATRFSQLKWWLGNDVFPGAKSQSGLFSSLGLTFGTRGHAVAASIWIVWLGFLCVHNTGDDYMHFTKRVGIVAASQFPILYMLNMKSGVSPLAIAFSASHEELNPYHRILGRIIYSLLLLHGVLYINYFLQVGVLLKRLTDKDVIIGVTALSLLTILISAALEPIRRFSYRIFFISHLTIGVTVLPLLFFHVTHLRIYMVEALVFFIMDLTLRKLDTVTVFTKITAIPSTTLLKFDAPIPRWKMSRFRKMVGGHVYVNIPPESASNPIHQVLFNPYTVAAVNQTSITLVARVYQGPTTHALKALTKLPKANPPLKIEGPYGSAELFPNFAVEFDRILLIAGGVGGTFILPIYRQIMAGLAVDGSSGSKLKLVWSVKTENDASWAADLLTDIKDGDDDADEETSSPKDKTRVATEHSNMEIHITGSAEPSSSNETEIPLQNLSPLASHIKSGRPDLPKLIDGFFRASHGAEERVAVLVCGTRDMGAQVREDVGRWVARGRYVWFHNERFGW